MARRLMKREIVEALDMAVLCRATQPHSQEKENLRWQTTSPPAQGFNR
jgi:hypothetical protein